MKSNSLSRFSDEYLMGLIARSDKAAFTEMYDRWVLRVKQFFLRLCNYEEDLANDLTQDVFLKILEKAQSFNENLSFSSWLFTIAYNHFKNALRQIKQDESFREENVFENDIYCPDTEKNMDVQISMKWTEKLLDVLTVDVKTIFVLRYAEELSIPEISRIVGVPEGTVKSRLYYAMKKLIKERQKYQINEWI